MLNDTDLGLQDSSADAAKNDQPAELTPKPITELPVQFNKDYSLSAYQNAAYYKLLSMRNSHTNASKIHTPDANQSQFYRLAAIAGAASTALNTIGQLQVGRMSLIGNVLGLNSFGIQPQQASATWTSQNPDLFMTSNSYSTTMLCITTVCTPPVPTDLVNTMEFIQCVQSCLANPRVPLALYTYKNYDNLDANLRYTRETTARLPPLLTVSLVNEGLDVLRRPDSGLNPSQIEELNTFRSKLLSTSLPPPPPVPQTPQTPQLPPPSIMQAGLQIPNMPTITGTLNG